MMGILRPYIDHRVQNLVLRLASAYRDSNAEYPVLLGVAAQISCLMDLLSDLDNRARRGDIAMQQEIKDAEKTR